MHSQTAVYENGIEEFFSKKEEKKKKEEKGGGEADVVANRKLERDLLPPSPIIKIQMLHFFIRIVK